MTDAFVLDYVRTPRGRASARGALHEHSPVDLVVHLAKALQGRTNLAAEQIDDVVLGCASQVDEQGANIARTAALLAGWGDSVPGATSIDSAHPASTQSARARPAFAATTCPSSWPVASKASPGLRCSVIADRCGPIRQLSRRSVPSIWVLPPT